MNYENKKNDDDIYKKGGEYDPELVVDATPAADNGPPIPPGHQRFYCEKCRAVRVIQRRFWYRSSPGPVHHIVLCCVVLCCVVLHALCYVYASCVHIRIDLTCDCGLGVGCGCIPTISFVMLVLFLTHPLFSIPSFPFFRSFFPFLIVFFRIIINLLYTYMCYDAVHSTLCTIDTTAYIRIDR